tara:strand:- start:549 stop:1175 length:627 start_codon:yes stop_codon:yes gene_type:complete
MAISNYSELNTAVANWLDRDDLTDRIPEFIALAEARFNRLLRIRAMETKQTASTVASQRTLALPTNFIQMRNLQINTTPVTPMQYVTPEIYDRLYGSTAEGTPEMYTILADEIQLGPIPGSVQTIEMLFYKKFDALTSSATTNWMITNAPDVYLYGCLLEAEPFIMNDPRVQLWATAFQQAIKDIQEQDNKDRHSGSALRVMNTSGYY